MKKQKVRKWKKMLKERKSLIKVGIRIEEEKETVVAQYAFFFTKNPKKEMKWLNRKSMTPDVIIEKINELMAKIQNNTHK